MIHDADLRDNKFGRPEGIAIDVILTGWASQGVEDEVLLARGVHCGEIGCVPSVNRNLISDCVRLVNKFRVRALFASRLLL